MLANPRRVCLLLREPELRFLPNTDLHLRRFSNLRAGPTFARVFADMRVGELLRILSDDGWYEVRTGKHILLRHRTKGGTLVVPNHRNKELAAGTVNSILKAAGLK